MTASVDFFSTMVTIALVMTVTTPVILLVLFVRDWKRGTQW